MKDRSYDEITQSHDAEVQTTQKAEKKTETYTFGGKEYLREVTPPHQFKTPLELLHYLWREYDCPAAWGVWKEIWSPAGSGRPKGFWREWKGLRVEIHETDAGHHEYQITNGEDIFAQSSRVPSSRDSVCDEWQSDPDGRRHFAQWQRGRVFLFEPKPAG
jgi:hypothetical protein